MVLGLPVIYGLLMAAAGVALAVLVRYMPELQSATVPPLVWLILIALVYETVQRFVEALRLPPVTPMQRFTGYFIGATLYLILIRGVN